MFDSSTGLSTPVDNWRGAGLRPLEPRYARAPTIPGAAAEVVHRALARGVFPCIFLCSYPQVRHGRAPSRSTLRARSPGPRPLAHTRGRGMSPFYSPHPLVAKGVATPATVQQSARSRAIQSADPVVLPGRARPRQVGPDQQGGRPAGRTGRLRDACPGGVAQHGRRRGWHSRDHSCSSTRRRNQFRGAAATAPPNLWTTRTTLTETVGPPGYAGDRGADGRRLSGACRAAA
jgi:hypothetical protein